MVQFACYLPYGEALADEHTVTDTQPYKFSGKEFDGETGLYYFGARYYNPRLALWYGVDALAEKYPSMGGFVYCAANPVKYVDPDGESPIGAVLEGVGAFAISAGVDFLSNWLLEGNDYKTAFKSVAWGSAALDGLSTATLSFFVDGTGTAKTLAKIGKSKGGRLAIDIVQSMVVNITSKLEKGEMSFSDIDLQTEFLEATFSSLLSNGLTKKADELLETLKDSNKNLYAKLSKLQRNTEVGKSDARIKSDKHKVDIARKNVNNDAMRYAKEKLIGKGKAAIITKSIGAASDKKATNGEN